MYDPMLFRDRDRPAQIALGGVVPALKAYRTPVAETLAPLS